MDTLKENRRTLAEGFRAARELAGGLIADKTLRRGVAVVDEAAALKDWEGFTGNAQLSYGVSVSSLGGLWGEYTSGDGARSALRRKVELGERVFLEDPYEGVPRAVTGRVEIEWPHSDDALDAVLGSNRSGGRTLAKARFAFPVEYLDQLGHRSDNPLKTMHQLASVDMKDLR